jgi:MoaA/NifB/PqqE/SkfB family radical SAM enzyme
MNYFDQICETGNDNIRHLLIGTKDLLKAKALFKNNVEIINLETSYQCNRKCDYCPVADSDRQQSQSVISNELLRKIAADLSEIRYENRISLNLYNEPLLDTKFEEKIALLRDVLPHSHLSFNTNGDKLDKTRLTSLIDAGINSLCVTLHPQPHKIDTENTLLRRIRKLMEKCGVPIDENIEIEKKYYEFRIHGSRIKVQWPNWRESGTNRGGTVILQSSANKIRDFPCVKPFREFTVYYDGTVQPCCESFHDADKTLVTIADLNVDSVFEAYASLNLSQFRKSVFSFSKKGGICTNCMAADYSIKGVDDLKREAILNLLAAEERGD